MHTPSQSTPSLPPAKALEIIEQVRQKFVCAGSEADIHRLAVQVCIGIYNDLIAARKEIADLQRRIDQVPVANLETAVVGATQTVT